MAFNYQAQPLPILNPQQMNPYSQALQSGLNTFQNVIKSAYLPSQLKEDLVKAQLENKINNVKAQYAPTTVLADASSKLAYANLMGPQFLAKLINNPDILSNIPDDQKKQTINALFNAGSQPSTAINPMLAKVLGATNQEKLERPTPIQQFAQNFPEINRSLQDQFNRTGEAQYTIPYDNSPIIQQKPSPTFAENRANYESVVSEGKEAGNLRAKDIQELGNIYQNSLTKEATLNHLGDILKSPEIEQIRQLPFAQKTELGYFSKFGTPEQKRQIGRFITTTGEIVKDSAADYKGQFRVGEQALIQNMKVNESDTLDVAKGKIEALMLFNSMMKERSKLVGDLMENGHISKLKAVEQADKLLDGNQIRDRIQNQLNPPVTIRNKKTGETRTLSFTEAQRLLGR